MYLYMIILLKKITKNPEPKVHYLKLASFILSRSFSGTADRSVDTSDASAVIHVTAGLLMLSVAYSVLGCVARLPLGLGGLRPIHYSLCLANRVSTPGVVSVKGSQQTWYALNSNTLKKSVEL